jgi:N-acetyl-gamma-glutamyl-phosphate reductase
MKNYKIKIGIVGGAGYTGGELIRLILLHPAAEISFVHSRSNSGKLISDVHTDLFGDTEIIFTDKIHSDVDVIFLCLGHGESSKWLKENSVGEKIRIIDLSQDFRLHSTEHDFVYGLPEFQREKISSAKHIANPGCFATAIQLALLPLAEKGLLKDDIQISAVTGSTGAGQSLSATSHFTWRFGNHSAYKTLEHQHLAEISQTIFSLNNSNEGKIHFIPQRGTFTRGIHATIHFPTNLKSEEAKQFFSNYYSTHPFTHVSEKQIDLKQVINTNKCLLHVEVINERIVITSIIDNLLKGASGQAVQNMNLLFGIEETTGLKLKSIAY